MRWFCRDEHKEPDRCPPHDFNGALWDDVGTSTTLSVIFCGMCGDIRQLQVPDVAPSELEKIATEASDH